MSSRFDALMGLGKTSYILKMLNESYAQDLGREFCDRRKFLIVVPLLTEVDRFTLACPGLQFKNPQQIEGRKLYDLERRIEAGENIVTTHALFKLLNRSIYKKLQGQDYSLIIDGITRSIRFTRVSSTT
jgi:hypothetical protein